MTRTGTRTKMTKDALRALGIYNDHDLMRKASGVVYIGYQPSMSGRLARSAQWVVSGNGFDTNPDGGYSDRSKAFVLRAAAIGSDGLRVRWSSVSEQRQAALAAVSEQRQAALAAAQAFAAQWWSGEWARSPFGGWHPAATIAAMQAILDGADASGDLAKGDADRRAREAQAAQDSAAFDAALRTLRSALGDSARIRSHNLTVTLDADATRRLADLLNDLAKGR